MKKKNLVSFLLAIIAIVCLLAFVACNNDGEQPTEPSTPTNPTTPSTPSGGGSSSGDSDEDEAEAACQHTNTKVLEAVAATCDTQGKTEGKQCTDCDAITVQQRTIAALGHDFERSGAVIACKRADCSVSVTDTAGITYDIIPGTTTCKVVLGPVNTNDSGTIYDSEGDPEAKYIENISIPSTVTIADNVYTVVEIADNAFKKCKATLMFVPESVTVIGNSAFEKSQYLKQIFVFGNITTIGDRAFANCPWIEQFKITKSITSIGTDAFSGCIRLGNFDVDADNTTYAQLSGILYDKAMSRIIHIPAALSGDVVIPASITTISDGFLKNMTGVTSITLGDDVTSIGANAFAGLVNLQKVTLGNGITSIGAGAFHGCVNLKGVYIKDISAWLGISFADRFSNPAQEFSCDLYLNDALLTELVVPEGVTAIGNYAFIKCASLKKITLPASLLTIGDYAFYGCDGIVEITIPEKVTAIGAEAFYDCNLLEKVTLPATLKSIGDRAFKLCSELADIVYTGTEKQWKEDIAFGQYWNEGVLPTCEIKFAE